MSYAEVKEAFNWDYEVNDEFFDPHAFNDGLFYGEITNGQPFHSRVKSSTLPHPALRIVHRFIAETILCHGEPHNLPKFDLKCLWVMTSEGIGCPDWVDIFVQSCLELAKKKKGRIVMGGMVDLLAMYFNVEDPTGDELAQIQLKGDPQHNTHLYTFDQLAARKMLWFSRPRNTFLWLFGPNRTKYMRLPQPNKTTITDQTTTAQLYIPPDDDFRAAVLVELRRERREPQAQGQGHEEGENEEEGDDAGNDKDDTEEVDTSFRATMTERMVALEASQQHMENTFVQRFEYMDSRFDQFDSRFNQFEDTLYSMSSMVQAMNQFHVTSSQGYQDPSARIEAERQQRMAERAAERAAWRARYGDPGSSSGH